MQTDSRESTETNETIADETETAKTETKTATRELKTETEAEISEVPETHETVIEAEAHEAFPPRTVVIVHRVTPETLRRLLGLSTETAVEDSKNDINDKAETPVENADNNNDIKAEAETDAALPSRTEKTERRYAQFAETLRARLIG